MTTSGQAPDVSAAVKGTPETSPMTRGDRVPAFLAGTIGWTLDAFDFFLVASSVVYLQAVPARRGSYPLAMASTAAVVLAAAIAMTAAGGSIWRVIQTRCF